MNQIHQQLLFLKPNILQFQDHHEYKQNEEESYKQLNRKKKKLQKKIKQLEIWLIMIKKKYYSEY